MADPAPRSIPRLLLVGVLLVAAALRLSGLSTMPGFSGDEGYEAYYAWQVGEHGVFRLNPVRPYLGPYFLWLVAPWLAAFDPGPGVFRLTPALLGVGSVGLGWAAGRRWGGPALGLTTAALLACATWAVGFQRLCLSVGTLPFLTLLAWLLLLRLWDRPGPGRAAALGAAVGAAAAFHPQGLLLGPAFAAASLLHPGGRALLRLPAALAAGLAGFSATAWVVWRMILDQVGLGPGVDYSGTLVDSAPAGDAAGRLLDAGPVFLSILTGPRVLRWFTGVPGDELAALALPAAALALLGLGLGVARAARSRDPVGLGLCAALAAALLLTAVKAASFDLHVLSRERYLLVAVTLGTLLLAYGFVGREGEGSPSVRRAGIAAAALSALLQLGLLQVGFFGPYRSDGGRAEPSFVAATPDAKVQAADWILARLAPGEEGLLLAGDGWSYWPLVALLEERLPADFVPEQPQQLAAVLARTRHRRRFLVDYPGWHWTDEILAGLAAYGRPELPPALVPLTPDGRPALHVWELPPEPAP